MALGGFGLIRSGPNMSDLFRPIWPKEVWSKAVTPSKSSPNKIGQTRRKTRTKTLEEELEVARKSLELRPTDMERQVGELKELKEANTKTEADKIRGKDLENGRNCGRCEMDPHKERQTLLHRWAGHMARADTQRHQRHSEQAANNGGERRTNKTQIKMGRNTSQKILMLEVGSADYRIATIQGWINKKKKDNAG